MLSTREEIEARIAEAFTRFQRGYSREAEIAKLANDIEATIKEAVDKVIKEKGL